MFGDSLPISVTAPYEKVITWTFSLAHNAQIFSLLLCFALSLHEFAFVSISFFVACTQWFVFLEKKLKIAYVLFYKQHYPVIGLF